MPPGRPSRTASNDRDQPHPGRRSHSVGRAVGDRSTSTPTDVRASPVSHGRAVSASPAPEPGRSHHTPCMRCILLAITATNTRTKAPPLARVSSRTWRMTGKRPIEVSGGRHRFRDAMSSHLRDIARPIFQRNFTSPLGDYQAKRPRFGNQLDRGQRASHETAVGRRMSLVQEGFHL
jgi:hypothetical protein